VRTTPAGVMKRFAIPTASSGPSGIAVGPDGAVWFAETGSGKIARVEADGGIKEFAIPPLSDGGTSAPFDLTAGPDGNLWVTLQFANAIARVTTAGHVTEFPLPSSDAGRSDLSPYVIVAAPDNNLWFTSFAHGVVSRITTEGVVSYFPASERSFGIAVGPDGALWFAMQGKIGRVTLGASPTVTEFAVAGFLGAGIVAGPDCESLYADDALGNRIRRFAPPLADAGPDAALVFTDFDLKAPNSDPQSIARGPEGTVWFAEVGSGKIGFLR
jgi:streptogramin lyase